MNTPALPIVSSNTDKPLPARQKTDTDGSQFAQAMNDSKNVLAETKGKDLKAEKITDKAPKQPADKKLPDNETHPMATLTLIIDTNALPITQGKANGELATENTDSKQTLLARFGQGQIPGDIKADSKETAIRYLPINQAASTDKKSVRTSLLPDTETKNINKAKSSHQTEIQTKPRSANDSASISQINAKTGITDSIENSQAGQLKTAGQPMLLTEAAGHPVLHEGQSGIPGQEINSQFAASLAELNTNHNPVRQASIAAHLNSPNWPQDFGRQMVNISQNNLNFGHTVQMQINPPELGPVHITLHMNDGVTQATFVSPHAAVRNAIENAIPNLQDQMNQAGISLGQTNVSDQQPPQQGFEQNGQNTASNTNAQSVTGGQANGSATAATDTNLSRPRPRANALIDTFV